MFSLALPMVATRYLLPQLRLYSISILRKLKRFPKLFRTHQKED